MDACVFYTFLKSNPDMNQLVKHLTIAPQDPSLGCLADLIPLVLTHKMETFRGSVNGNHFFKVLLSQTFGDEGMAKFKSLTTIPSAWNYSNVYDNLLHKLRYVLKEITLNFHRNPPGKAMKWPTLYRLNKMAQLQALTFNSYVHNVKQTEAILKNCGRLEHLTIRLAVVGDLFGGEAKISQWIEINTQQHDILGTLKIRIDKKYNPYFIDYLVYKYPNLKSITVEKIDIEEPWGRTYSVMPLDINSIKDILVKIEKVPSYTLVCKVLKSKVGKIIIALESNGYVVSKTNQSHAYSRITVTRSSSDRSIQDNISRSTTHPAPLKVCCPCELNESIKSLLQK
ncbi:hypothetical protein V8B55DRAFT_1411258 [Mucor lusitanicus]|uniref:Uncharacterized protein n=1 Tax=Mucor lusitanicus CBS 277.49 TaxID=747725 RepID=A0A162THJ7_MUCCL|nr:hypothetical protein MUCCIDRAFT_79737 [Mucor lusitanicus CBS 277.49]